MLQFIYFKIDTFSITTTSRDAPDTDFAGYPAKPKAGYRISGRISGRAIWYPAGYRLSKKAGLSGQPDIRCIPIRFAKKNVRGEIKTKPEIAILSQTNKVREIFYSTIIVDLHMVDLHI
jgi:hypothetical protein